MYFNKMPKMHQDIKIKYPLIGKILKLCKKIIIIIKLKKNENNFKNCTKNNIMIMFIINQKNKMK